MSVVAPRAGVSLIGVAGDQVHPSPDISAPDRPEAVLVQVFAQLARLARPRSAQRIDATTDLDCSQVDDEGAADARSKDAAAAVVHLAAAAAGGAMSAHLSLHFETNGSVSPLTEGTDAAAVLFAAAERDTCQGPSVSARSSGETTLATDVTCDPRWPALASRLALDRYAEPPVSDSCRPDGARVGTVLAVPLVDAAENAVGVLTFTRPAAGALDPACTERLTAFAEAAGSILLALGEAEAQQRLARQLETALGSRAVIDQAKGVLMQRRGCDDQTAFTLLSQASQRANVKLRDVARMLVEDTQSRRVGDTHTRRTGGQHAVGTFPSRSRS